MTTAEERPETGIERYCSPEHLIAALTADEAPLKMRVKLARGYAEALDHLDDAALHEWTQAMATKCLSRGWHETALAMLCTPSEQHMTTDTEEG